APTGQETVEVAKDFFGPEIDAAFAGITGSEFDHRNSLRPEEQEQRDDPEPDGYATVGRNRRNDVQVKNGDHEQQNQIAPAENAFEMGLGFRGGDLDCQLSSPKNLRGIMQVPCLACLPQAGSE